MQQDPAFPRWANVRVTLGDQSTRTGHVLVDHGDRVHVEYTTPAGYFAARHFARSAVELLPTTLCGTHGSRNRVCAAATGHVGNHTFVIRSERED
jgi:hypothetical protein